MKTITRIFYYIRAFSISVLCGAGVSLGFIFSQNMADFIASSTRLRVNPSMTGGEAAAEFFQGDEFMVRYMVFNPVHDGVWQKNPDYWQIEETFSKKISDFSSIGTFLADDSGNRYEILCSRGKAQLFDGERNFICDCETFVTDEGRNIKLRVPIINSTLRNLYTARTTYHRIVADGKEEAVFEVKMGVRDSKESMEGRIAEIKGMYGNLKKSLQEKEAAQTAQAENGFDAAKVLFNQGRTDEAEGLFRKIIDEGGENNPFYVQSLAWYGSCIALRAGKSGMFQAMKLVKESFVWLDRAATLAENSPFEIDVLMNRAEVAASVPDSVFHKAAVGASDFERVAELFQENCAGKILSEEETVFLAYIHASAAECSLRCGAETRAKINLSKAERILAE